MQMTPVQADERHDALHALADALKFKGDLTGALGHYREADQILRGVVAASGTRQLAALASTQERIGEVLLAQGDLAGALEALRAELELRRRLAATDPGDVRAREAVARVASRVAEVLVLKSAIATLPGAGSSQRPGAAAWNLSTLAGALERQGDLGGALALYREGLALRRRLAAQSPDNVAWSLDVSWSLSGLARALVARGDLAGALACLTEALLIRRRLAERDAGNPQRRLDMSWSLMALGDVLEQKGEVVDALSAFIESLHIRHELSAADPDNHGLRCDMAVSLTRIADVLTTVDDRSGALRALREAREMVRALCAQSPDHADWRDDLAALDRRIAELASPG
jgi:tetratricopeptide (TPR) repeat protein